MDIATSTSEYLSIEGYLSILPLFPSSTLHLPPTERYILAGLLSVLPQYKEQEIQYKTQANIQQTILLPNIKTKLSISHQTRSLIILLLQDFIYSTVIEYCCIIAWKLSSFPSISDDLSYDINYNIFTKECIISLCLSGNFSQ